MWNPKRLALLLVIPWLFVFVFVAAGAQAGSHSQAAAALVKTSPGHILVSAKGMTLYVFAKDTKGKIACTGACTKFWPPLMVAKGATVATSMPGIPGTFGEVMLASGKDQLTYDGAPVYTFANDKKPGDVNGEGVGGTWWAVVVSGATTSVTGY